MESTFSHHPKTPSVSWRNWNPILTSSTKDLELKFDKQKHYVIAFPHDRSKLMIAPFTPSTTDPLAPIATWLDNNLNPGPDQKAKSDVEKKVDIWLLVCMEEGKEEERKVLVDGFLKMGEERVLFLVGRLEVIGTGKWVDGGKMVLKKEVGSWLEVGNFRLDLKGNGEKT